ncbi:MAG: 16S rRNA (guanine(527)-N(7))-methyltransferase RsmG [Candidatus Acidiferrum sp.]|jgi:16S rRNA (guanine527-N7)-methyltransferase
MPTPGPTPLTDEAILSALAEFKLTASYRQVQQIQQYIAVLLKWNDKINLTAIRDPREILYRHFCESMYATVAVPVETGRLADVGSGGGFPGLPIKILRPDLHVFLIESNIKKATFLAEVSRDLELTNLRVLVNRFEDVGEDVAPLDYACSRALGEFAPFLEWAGSPGIDAKTVILWIGGRDLEEVKKIVGWEWREPIAVPQSLRRLLLVGTKKVPSNVGVTT